MFGINDHGMIIHLSGEELVELLNARADAHQRIAAEHGEKANELRQFITDHEGNADTLPNVLASKLRKLRVAERRMRKHTSVTSMLRMLASHAQPDNMFDGAGLTFLAYLYDHTNKKAMPPFWRSY